MIHHPFCVSLRHNHRMQRTAAPPLILRVLLSRQVLHILQQVYCQTDHGDARWPLYQCEPRRSRLSPLARRHDSQQNHTMDQTARGILRCGQPWVRRCSSLPFFVSVAADTPLVYAVVLNQSRSRMPRSVAAVSADSGVISAYRSAASAIADRSAGVSCRRATSSASLWVMQRSCLMWHRGSCVPIRSGSEHRHSR